MGENTNMANRKEPVGNSVNVVFSGGLQSRTRSTLLCELMKYLAFQRNQIPLPLDHVKRDLKRHAENEENTVVSCRRKPGLHRVEQRKAKEFVTTTDDLFEHLHSAFDQCPDIRQVLIIIGSTAVSPKEMFEVNIPAHYPDATPLSEKACIKNLFRQLITDNFLGSVMPLSASNMMLFLNAPRDCGLEWFQAKPRYKPPNRGHIYRLNWNCLQPLDSGTDLSLIDHHFDISGIQPFDSSDFEMSDNDTINPIRNSSVNDQSMADNDSLIADSISDSETLAGSLCNAMETDAVTVDVDGAHSLSDEDYIWFQAPVLIKGYKDRTSKVSS